MAESREWNSEVENNRVRDYSQIIGSVVKGTIDRPTGSFHPSKYPDLCNNISIHW